MLLCSICHDFGSLKACRHTWVRNKTSTVIEETLTERKTASINYNEVEDRPKHKKMDDTTETTEVSKLKQILGWAVGWIGKVKRMIQTISSPILPAPDSIPMQVSATFTALSSMQPATTLAHQWSLPRVHRPSPSYLCLSRRPDYF